MLFALLLACASAPPADAPGAPSAPPPVVLISLDTLRPDRLGAWGSEAGLTPNLDRFAEEAVVFERAYAQAGETLFSHASLFSGRYASEVNRLTYTFSIPEEIPLLPQILKAYGYDTGAAVAGGQLDPAFGFDRGFDSYAVPGEWASLYHTVPRALAWLDGRGEDADPFFLFVHGYDAHHRYLKPPPLGRSALDTDYRGIGLEIARSSSGTARVLEGHYFGPETMRMTMDFRRPRLLDEGARARVRALAANPKAQATPLSEQDLAFLRGTYDGAVSYADALFGLLMAGLEQRGVLDEAVVVVFSDHGEGLGEAGVFNHRYTTHDHDLQTVLMVRAPAQAPGRVSQIVELVDLLPTLLGYAGAEPPALCRGEDLRPLMAGEADDRGPAFSEGTFRQISVRGDAGRLTFSGASADSPLLADLIEAASLDGPSFSLEADLTPEGAAPLRDALVDWKRALPPSPEPTGEIDAPLRQKLRDAGYWGVQ